MLVNEVISNEPESVAEVREELMEIRKEREDDDMGYSISRGIDHVEKFSKLTGEEARDLRDELESTDKVSPEIAVKIVDVLPQDADEVRAIYSKERFALDGDKIDEILSIVEKHT